MVPAAAFIELVLAAIAQIGGPGPRELADVEFHRALVIAEMEPRRLQLALDESSFSVRSRAGAAADDEAWTLHASGNLIRGGTGGAPADPVPSLEDSRSRCREPVSLATFYDALEGRGIEYGPAMRCIGEIWRNNGEAVATLQPPAPGATTVEQRAALLDGCLQLITAAAGAAVGSTDTSPYLPTRVERVHSAAGAAEEAGRSPAARRPPTPRPAKSAPTSTGSTSQAGC